MARIAHDPEHLARIQDRLPREQAQADSRRRYALQESVRLESRPSLLASGDRPNHPATLDISGYSTAEIQAAARAAFWVARQEHDLRAVESVTGPSAWPAANLAHKRRILMSVFLGDVAEVERVKREREKADVIDREGSF